MKEQDAFVKDEYQIHIKDCVNRVMHKLKRSTLSPEMKISVDEYHHRLKLAISSNQCNYQKISLKQKKIENN
jgi:hypothetical protein